MVFLPTLLVDFNGGIFYSLIERFSAISNKSGHLCTHYSPNDTNYPTPTRTTIAIPQSVGAERNQGRKRNPCKILAVHKLRPQSLKMIISPIPRIAIQDRAESFNPHALGLHPTALFRTYYLS